MHAFKIHCILKGMWGVCMCVCFNTAKKLFSPQYLFTIKIQKIGSNVYEFRLHLSDTNVYKVTNNIPTFIITNEGLKRKIFL